MLCLCFFLVTVILFPLFPEIIASTQDGTTSTPTDSAMEINASNGQVGIQESSPISTDGLSTATHPNDTEVSSPVVSVSECLRTPGQQDVPKEHKASAQGVSAELQNGNAELPTELAAPSITTEPVTLSEDATMEHVEMVSKVAAEDVIKESEVADQNAEPVTAESIAAAKDVIMEVTDLAHDAAPMPEVAAQGVTIYPVTSAQCVIPEPNTAAVNISMEHEKCATVEASDVVTEQSVNMETVTKVPDQVTTTEPVVASMDIPKEPMVVAEHVPAEPVGGDRDTTLEPEAAEQGVTSVSEAAAESGIRETVADAEDVTTEAATQGDTAEEPSPAIHGVGTNPVVVPQEITKELDATEKDATTTKHDAQGITTELGVAVQSATEVQGVTTEPVISALSMKPEAAVEDIPKEFAPAMAQNATTKSSSTAQNELPDVATAPADSTTEPQNSQSVTHSNESSTALEVTVKHVMLRQEASSETNTTPSVNSVTASEAQNLSREVVQEVSTEPVTAAHNDQGVSKEPETASPDTTNRTETGQRGESVTPEQEVAAKSAPAAEDFGMDTTETDQGAACRPSVAAGSTFPTGSTAEHVPMELDPEMEKIATGPAETVQDVVMESQDESKGVVQDVTMEPLTEIQDPAEDLKAETQGTGPKPGVTDQVVAPAENGTCESKALSSDGVEEAVAANEVGAVQTTTSAKGATSDVNNSTEAEVKQTSVQDDLDQSFAVAQDGSDPSKAVAQAAGEDGAEPHKGVLSFYSTPAQEAVFTEIQNAKFFSIICEQQIEIEGHTYIPVGICYLEKRKTPCEDVLAYVPLDQDVDVFVDSLTAALSEKWGLNLAFCRGQSLLTVGSAGAQVRAAASLLSQRYPYAVRTFSSSVSLNTWLAKSCIISEIADSYTWVERMLQWVTEDEKKRAILHKMVTSLFQHDAVKHSDLTDRLSRSQWERSHDTLDLTVEVLEAVMLSLNDIKDNHEIQSESTQAGDFLIILQNFEFILTLVIMKNVLGPTKGLSQSLQGQPLDLYQAVNSLSKVLSSLSDMKTNIDAHLQTWYQEAVAFASKLQISVDHTSQECLIIYCRDIISKGAIDHSICEITEIFSGCVLSAVRCLQVVPYVISKTEGCCTDSDLFTVYLDDFPDSSSVQAELLKWREKWLHVDPAQQPLPAGLLDTLNATDAETFPNIETLLRLLMVLPCFRREDLIRQGKKSLVEFNQQRSLLELYPL